MTQHIDLSLVEGGCVVDEEQEKEKEDEEGEWAHGKRAKAK